MKGGKTPTHRHPWYPADYHSDEHVRLLKARRDYRTLTFYRHFIDASWMAGGDLPADPEALAAVVEMPRRDVEQALAFCLGRLIFRRGDRLYQKRVVRDAEREQAYRAEQTELGRKGGETAGRGRPKKPTGLPLIEDRPTPLESDRPAVAVAVASSLTDNEPSPNLSLDRERDRRDDQSNPRAQGTNPRALGTNPRAIRADQAAQLAEAEAYASSIGLRLTRQERRHLREAVRALPWTEVQRGLDQAASDEAARLGLQDLRHRAREPAAVAP